MSRTSGRRSSRLGFEGHPAEMGSRYALFDIGKTRAILFGPSPYSGVLPGGGAGNGLH